MKKILNSISILLFLTGLSTNAQIINPQKGDKQYDNLAYTTAIKAYEKEAQKGNKSVELFEKLGNSYYFNAKLVIANKWYTELFALNQTVEPEYYYRYSQTLKAIGDYYKSNAYLDKFNEISSNDTRAIEYQNQKNYKEIIDKNSGRYEIKNTSINTKASDYGSSIFGNQLIFATSRDSIGFSKTSTKWTGHSYTNLYTAMRAEDGSLSSPKKFSSNVNSKLHEDTPVFTKDLQTVYFTRNNLNNGKIGKNKEQAILLKLYDNPLLIPMLKMVHG